MTRRAFVTVAVLALACSGEDGPGDSNGHCDYETDANGAIIPGSEHVPGDYRCAGQDVEICTHGEDPLRDRPSWVVLADCDDPLPGGVYGACVLNLVDGIARCVYPESVGRD
jgi:hypothetical protein